MSLQISRLALEYNRCDRSHPGEPEGEGRQEGTPSAAGAPSSVAESVSSAAGGPPCCNTVVLPPEWHALSRTHNVCELCVNQSARIRPSRLGRLRCNFLEMAAALDSFYLKERTFFHVAPKAASLCSNFLRSYSPFTSYTACCRTVEGPPLSFASPRETPAAAPASDTSLTSRGERQGDGDTPSSRPHIEAGRGRLPGRVPCGSAITGLSCRTNKTLNLYLLDSGLFWTYAVRLGASPAAPVKEFAAIVDLREETHYVLDQDQPLLTASLGTYAADASPPPHLQRFRHRGTGRVSLAEATRKTIYQDDSGFKMEHGFSPGIAAMPLLVD